MSEIPEAEERMPPEQRSAETRASGRSLAARILRLLVGLALSVLLGIGLGVLGFVGLPWLYRGFSEPAQANATRIAQQGAELAELRATFDQLSSQEGEQLDALQGQLLGQAAALDEQQGQLAALESDLEELQRSLSRLSGSGDRLARQEAALSELAGEVQALRAALEQGGTPLELLERRLQLAQASLHMLRARIGLIENNAGLAAQEVEAAQAALAQALEKAPLEEQAPMQEVVARLELTLEDLQLRPFIAADDLEIAWQLLADLSANP